MPAIRQRRVVGQLEAEDLREKIVVIARHTTDNLPIFEVRSLRWGPGIGWYSQKTLTLTPAQASLLAKVLRKATQTRSLRAERGKVVPFRRQSK